MHISDRNAVIPTVSYRTALARGMPVLETKKHEVFDSVGIIRYTSTPVNDCRQILDQLQ